MDKVCNSVPTAVVPRKTLNTAKPEEWDQAVESALDSQVGGTHYKEMPLQPIEYIMANNLPYCEANVIKYITRHALKGGKQDVEKAIHYCQLLLETKYADE